MKERLASLNSISIKIKIAMGFIFCFFLFLAQFFYANTTLQKIDSNIEELTVLSTYSSRILGINKDVSEIQRLVLAYGQTGSEALLKKLDTNLIDIQKNLNSFDLLVLSKSQSEKLKSLISISNRYKENIISLKNLKQQRKKYAKIGLRQSFEATKQLIEKNIKSATHRTLLLGDLYTMFFFAQDFINNKTYPSKKKFYQAKSDTLKKIKKLKLRERKFIWDQHRKFSNIFEKAIIANRNYLSLVNVVMSGDVTEFSILTQSLKDEIFHAQNANRTKTEKQVRSSLKLSLIAISLLIPLLILIIIYYNQNISISLSLISSTFSKFLQRDFSDQVPGLDRGDEIGQLAKAAEEFKSISQLLQKEKVKAQNLTKIKSDFLANMSHEIRTPMNGIMGMVDHLLETPIETQQREMLNTINSCGNSLTTILNDILDISKIESGKMELESIPVNLSQLVEELRFLFNPRAQEKKLTYTIKVVGENPPDYFFGDVTRLKQIIINLLSNAFKFTSSGEVSLIIESTPRNDKHATLNFKVRDSGIGIAPEKQKLVFEEFSQSDTSTTREYGGTGLGLTISQHLAQLMYSKIELESEIGTGSTFSFSIVTKLLSNLEKEQIEVKNNNPLLINQSGHCLIVEDNEINIKVLALRLKKIGLTYDVAYNGQEAIEKGLQNPYDIIFMDLQMPVMGGLSATRELRKEKCQTPIVAMTANVQASDRNACLEAGMNYFVGKPVKKEELQKTITQILNSKNLPLPI